LALQLKFSAIPTRWKIGLPMFALVLVAILGLRKGGSASSTKTEDLLTASVRLSKTILPAGTARDWNAELGVRLAKSKQYGAARRVFEEILLLEPTNVSLLNNIAFVCGEQGDFARAAEYLQTAIQVSENCAECFNNLGSLLYKQGKKAEAKTNFERATKIDGNYVDPKLNLAVMLEEESDWPGALEWYRQVVPLLQDPEVKKWVDGRAAWMLEIAQSTKRQVAGESAK